MKHAVLVSALAAGAVAVVPSFLNSDFDVKEGASFTLEYSGCRQGGCTIVLQTGPTSNTQDVRTMTTTATGDAFTFVPKDIATGTYNFKIISNTDGSEFNFSKQFNYLGAGTTGAASSISSGVTSLTSNPAATLSSTANGTASTTELTTMTSVTGSSTLATSGFTNTTALASTATRSAAAVSTTIPNAGGRASPLVRAAGVVVAAMAIFG